MKIDWDEAVDRLYYIERIQRLYRILPEDFAHRTFSVIMDGDKKWHQFLKTALSDPVACSALFVVFMPPEEYETRLQFYQFLFPIWVHRYLCLLAKRHSKWESHFKALARDFLFVVTIDLQKSLGKSGTIKKLRENFERASVDKDGTVRIKTDLWPRARIIWLSKSDRVEVEVHQLRDEKEYAFSNQVDYSIIGWMQSFRDHPEIRDAAYAFGKRGKKVWCSVYKPDGKLEKKFPLALREKYAGLRGKMKSAFPVEDAEQEFDLAFFESIFGYTEKKGYPPGYFRKSVLSRLSNVSQKSKGFYIDPFGKPLKSFEEETGGGIPIKEIVKSEPQSDHVLVKEALRDVIGEFMDEKDRIIVENYEKSDSQIAKIIAKRTGKPISKQAVQKRKTKIRPILKGLLELRLAIREEEDRQGTDLRTRKR